MHDYSDFAFPQAQTETKLGKRTVPTGYVNATAMCKGAGKKLNDWSRLKRSKAYLEALSSETGIPVSQLIITIDIDGQSGLQGSWAHPEVAISIAAWISPKFEVWANRTLRLVVAGDFTPKTADAAIAQSQLKQRYDRILNQPDPWKKMYEPEFCTQVYAWYGPQFYWTFCYCFLTPTERCKIDELNPPINGVRKHKIHQYLPAEIKQKLTPYVDKLVAIIDTADGDKATFIKGYRKHFNGTAQLELF